MGEYIKVHKMGIIILSVTILVSAFVGTLAGIMIINANYERQEVVYDTLYLQPSYADSLMKDISVQVKEINTKIPSKKSIGKRRTKKNDIIKIDAHIHLDKEDSVSSD